MKHGGAKLTSKYFITQGEQFALWPSLTERGAEGGVRGMQASKTLHHHTCRALRGGRGVQFILPLVIGIVLLFTVFRENGCCRQQGRCGLTSFIRTEREALRISWVGISEGQRRICGFGGEGGQQHPSIFATWKKLQLAQVRGKTTQDSINLGRKKNTTFGMLLPLLVTFYSGLGSSSHPWS